MVQVLKINGIEVRRGRVTAIEIFESNTFKLPNPDSKFHAVRLGGTFHYGNGIASGGGIGQIKAIRIQGEDDYIIGGDDKSIEVQAQ